MEQTKEELEIEEAQALEQLYMLIGEQVMALEKKLSNDRDLGKEVRKMLNI